MRLEGPKRPKTWPALLLFVLLASGAQAQEFIGARDCMKCHNALAKASLKHHDPRSSDNLKAPKAAEYARATGGNVRDARCLRCHQPVNLAAGPAAVSCETCHGPGKAYKVPHQDHAFYSQPDRKGLVDLYKKAGDIANLCIRCHVLGGEDTDIAAAGHRVGEKFDLAKALATLVHWPSEDTDPSISAGDRKRTYDAAFYAQVAKLGAPTLNARAAAAGAGRAAVARPPAGAPPVAAPPGTRPPAPGGSGVTSRNAGGSNDEYQMLADDEFLTPPTPPPPRVKAPAPAPPPSGATAARAPAPAQVQRAAPVTRTSVPDVTAGVFDAPPVRPVASSPSARDVASLRGQAARVLQSLIQKKKKLDIPPPAPPAAFTGEGAELLVLQDEVLSLALEVLRE